MSKFDPVTMDLPETDPAYPSTLIPFTFESKGQKLLARFMVAAGKGPHPVAIILHGFPGNEPNFDVGHALRRAGWNCLFFHYRGAWGSPGKFSFENALEDGLSAVDFVASPEAADEFRCDPAKIMIVGHSMGGFIGLHTAAKDRRVSGVATIGAFNFGAFGKWLRQSQDNVAFAVDSFRYSVRPVQGTTAEELIQSSMENIEKWDLELLGDAVRKTPLLIQYGTRDVVSIPESHHHSLMKALSENRVASLQEKAYDCDHMFLQVRMALCRQIVDWSTTLL
ncbi:MAG: alpha/beta hydrolase family protein [Bdellovibrionia bacterium]